MNESNVKRKLTAILYADVVGYSRLTGDDELGTHQRVMDALDLGTESINSGGGTVLRYAGDAILAEFSSVLAAVDAATSMQTELWKRNDDLPEGSKVQLRIGIHLGDVLEDRDEIYGDGVNIAARLETAAPPGGVCISSSVYEQVRGKVEAEFVDGGEEVLKNIAHPVHVYHWQPVTDGSESQRPEQLSLPDRPSIAVLPFDNMSHDPEQDFFADGITEDIITELSREKDLFVIARNSTFAYKGKSPDIRQVASELGVQYVLEGSVRRAGNKIRLNAQLIDAETNHHLWAERYDRALEDVFEVQDELTSTIINTLLQKFRDTGIDRALRRAPKSLDAYSHYLRAFGLLLRLNASDIEKAMHEARNALDLEPGYARAHMVLSWVYLYRWFAGWADDPKATLELSHEAAKMAIACDKDDHWGYGALGFAELFMHRYERALAAVDRAIALNPNNADARSVRAIVLNYVGRPEEALAEMELAARLNPHQPYWYDVGFGRAYYLLGQYEEAVPYIERLIDAGKDIATFRSLLAATYMASGRREEARAEISALLEAHPESTMATIRSMVPMKDEDALDHYMDLLRQAGLPE